LRRKIMKNIVGKVISGDRLYLTIDSTILDKEEIMEYCESKNIKPENVILMSDIGELCKFTELDKLNKQLEFLTSNVNENDTQLQAFAKIVMSLKKNIKCSERLKGTSDEIFKGVNEGKCSATMLNKIAELAFKMHGIDAETKDLPEGEYYHRVTLKTGKHSGLYIYDMSRSPEKVLSSVDQQTSEIIKEAMEESKDSVHKLPKESIFSKMVEKAKSLFRKGPEALPEPQHVDKPQQPISAQPKQEQVEEKMELYSAEHILDYEDRNSQLFTISSYQPEKLIGNVKTSYVELVGAEELSPEEIRNNEYFKEFYQALIEESEGVYIGMIEFGKDENGRPIPVSAVTAKDESCIGMEERVIDDVRQINAQKAKRRQMFEREVTPEEIQK